MENLKIRVTTKQESKEAQELFFDLGYGWHGKGKVVSYSDKILSDYFGWLVLWKPSYLTKTVIQMGGGFEDCKEITLPQLRDMVVLKRNEESDATHINKNTDERYLKIGEAWYVYHGGWVKSARNEDWILSKTTPITETEYLTQGENGARLNESIEQPRSTKGAETLNDKVASAEVARQKHSHYKKDVSHLKSIDVYRVLDLFNVEGHEVGHAIKKLLCSGQRGAKDHKQDIQEAIDSLNRHLEMLAEDEAL